METASGAMKKGSLAVRISGEVFVCHSLPPGVDRGGFDAGIFRRELQPADFAEHGDLFELVWGRDYRVENAEAFAKLVGANVLIHGHEPCDEGYLVPNDLQIILDCCSDKACLVVLPIDAQLTQEEIVERIQKLG